MGKRNRIEKEVEDVFSKSQLFRPARRKRVHAPKHGQRLFHMLEDIGKRQKAKTEIGNKMGEKTKIEWCDDSVSFWWGCKKVQSGCAHCYSAAGRGEKYFGDHPRLWIKTAAKTILKLDRKAKLSGRKRLVFINSMSDFFENNPSQVVDRAGEPIFWQHGIFTDQKYIAGRENGADWLTLDIATLRWHFFQLAEQCEHLIFVLCTKRPANIMRMWYGTKPPNIWLLTSVSDQATAIRNIPLLLQRRGTVPVLGVSVEPLLGPVNLRTVLAGLDWVIVGGESGVDARRCDVDWIRSLRDQCADAGVPFFIKQLGTACCSSLEVELSKTYSLSGPPGDPKGGDPAEWPEDLRVREFPKIVK